MPVNSTDSQRGGITVRTAAIIVGWLLTIIGAAWAMSADRTATVGRIEQAANVLSDHETRLRVIETQTERMATDVKWIRGYLEKSNSGRERP